MQEKNSVNFPNHNDTPKHKYLYIKAKLFDEYIERLKKIISAVNVSGLSNTDKLHMKNDLCNWFKGQVDGEKTE